MNNTVIPITLLTTVILVLAISFAPVQEAQSIHTTVIDDLVDQEQILSFRIVTTGAISDAVLVPDLGTVITGSVTGSIVAAGAAVTITDEGGVTIVTDGDGVSGDQLAVTAIGAGDQGLELDLAAASTVDIVIYLDTMPQV